MFRQERNLVESASRINDQRWKLVPIFLLILGMNAYFAYKRFVSLFIGTEWWDPQSLMSKLLICLADSCAYQDHFTFQSITRASFSATPQPFTEHWLQNVLHCTKQEHLMPRKIAWRQWNHVPLLIGLSSYIYCAQQFVLSCITTICIVLACGELC